MRQFGRKNTRGVQLLSALPKPRSLVAERAVRYLRDHDGPVDSVRLAAEILSTSTPDEAMARKVLQAAFSGDRRLVCDVEGWCLAGPPRRGARSGPEVDQERVLIFVRGGRPSRGQPFQIEMFSSLRLDGDEIVDTQVETGSPLPPGRQSAIVRALGGAAVVIHDPPGALNAIEKWLGAPLEAPISLRRLAQLRLGMRANHDLDALAARLGLTWRTDSEPLERADLLDACLHELRKPGESLHDLRVCTTRGAPVIDWSRFAFDRTFLRDIPGVPGTYRFFDKNGGLLYVGKSKNLNRRIGSYFREGQRRSPRVSSLLDRLHQIEYEHTGSDLEAVLREAEMIRRDNPEKNVQRKVHPGLGRAARLRSILILEPAEGPAVLRAYLIHHARLVARVAIGPRGGGLKRIERLLDDHFFFASEDPPPATGPDLDVELLARWLAAHRDRVVAFDPTHLRSAEEVTDRLRWFLDQGGHVDPEGTPIFTR